MRGESQVRFCEQRQGRFLPLTRQAQRKRVFFSPCLMCLRGKNNRVPKLYLGAETELKEAENKNIPSSFPAFAGMTEPVFSSMPRP